MKDEELADLIQEVSEKIKQLSESEKPLTKQEQNRKQVLLLQRDALKRLQEAKEKGNLQQEIRSSIDYSLLTELGEKHPFLMYLIKSHSSWNIL